MSALREARMSTVSLITFSRTALRGYVRPICTTTQLKQSNNDEGLKSANGEGTEGSAEEFRVYVIEGLKKVDVERKKRRQPMKPQTPRYRSMPTDQDWTDVWPTASTFKSSVVPFPVRQGYVENSSENEGVIPSKYGNLELMKGPNFLHLTPAHIKKHCAALKKFCTKWPEGLETDERCRQHFPVESVTRDYIFSAPSVQDDRARVASIRFHLSDLGLDYHAKDKFIRLVGSRYNNKTDMVVLESDRCPLKSQNMEFVKFLLTAVYFESWKLESWEDLKELSDMEKYFWDINTSKKTCLSLLKTIKGIDDASSSQDGRLSYLPADVSSEETVCDLPEVVKYKEAVEEMLNEGENIDTLNNYKNAVKNVFNIQSNVS